MKKLMRLLVLALLVSPPLSVADDTTPPPVQDESRPSHLTPVGTELSEEANAALSQLAQDSSLNAALQRIDAMLSKYTVQFDSQRKQYVFDSLDDYRVYIKKDKKRRNVQLVDAMYAQLLHAKAYLLSDNEQFAAALPLFQYLEQVAPVSVKVRTEKAYALGKSGEIDAALALYQHALELSRKYPSQKQYEAVALRGVGAMLIEQDKLTEAKAAFEDSLKAEPANPLALNELRYIDDLQKKKIEKSPLKTWQ